jgi:hypothetical protein
MKKIIFITILYLFVVSCKKKNGLELEIINKSILSLTSNNKDVYDNMHDSVIVDKSKTIVLYRLTNYDNKSYFFNLNYFGKIYPSLNGIAINKAVIYFYKDGGNEKGKIDVKFGQPNFDLETQSISADRNNQVSKMLNYSICGDEKFILDNSNFIIHPNETLYFEWFLNLPYGNTIQNAYVKFDKEKEYSAEIEMFSDSVNYKKMLSRPILKTIEKNGYEVYHGVIKSKNRVPIKFIE